MSPPKRHHVFSVSCFGAVDMSEAPCINKSRDPSLVWEREREIETERGKERERDRGRDRDRDSETERYTERDTGHWRIFTAFVNTKSLQFIQSYLVKDSQTHRLQSFGNELHIPLERVKKTDSWMGCETRWKMFSVHVKKSNGWQTVNFWSWYILFPSHATCSFLSKAAHIEKHCMVSFFNALKHMMLPVLILCLALQPSHCTTASETGYEQTNKELQDELDELKALVKVSFVVFFPTTLTASRKSCVFNQCEFCCFLSNSVKHNFSSQVKLGECSEVELRLAALEEDVLQHDDLLSVIYNDTSSELTPDLL